MRQLVIILALCAGCLLTASAQATFTQRVQQTKSGEGKVTITQSKAIDDLVNGPKDTAAPKKQTDKTNTATNQNQKDKQDKTDKQGKQPQGQESATRQQQQQQQQPADSTGTSQKKAMKGGRKVNGYRVQVFAGGNSRNDRIKAETVGSEIRALFPGVPVYVHFYSPRWICRMGNYTDYEEAHEVLNRVKSLGYESAIIVKGKVTVAYTTEN